MSVFINPLALIQKSRRRLEPPVLPSPDMEQYGERYQPGVAGNMMFREGVNDARAVPSGVPPPVLPSLPPQSDIPIDTGALPPPLAPPIPARTEGAAVPTPEMLPLPTVPPSSNLPQPNRTEQAILSTPPPPKSERRKGFWGRLKDMGESFILSGGNPLVAGLTAANPDILTRYKDRAINEPYWQKQRKMALGEAESLDEADRRDLLNEATQAQIANLGADNQRQASKDAYDFEQKRRDALSKSEKEAFDRLQASLNQRANLSKEGGEFVDSPSRLLFGSRGVDKATGKPLPITENQGNIIPSLDNKGFFRLPTAAQTDARVAANRVPPSLSIQTVTDDAGNVTKVVSDPKTGETRAVERIGSVGKTKTDPNEPTREDVAKYQAGLRKAEALISEADKYDAEGERIKANPKATPDDLKRATKLFDEAAKLRGDAKVLRAENRTLKRSVQAYQGKGKAASAATSKGKTPKDMSAEEFEYNVQKKFGGDRAAAIKKARELGYTVGGQAIQ